MEAKELRIGNLVEYYMPPQISEWIETSIDAAEIVGIYQCNIIDKNSGYRPIPLTKEWLLKFGFAFKRTDKANNYYLDNFRITFTDKNDIYLVYGNTLSFKYNKYNKYNIHQLQNLYFALTGEELDIK